MDRLVLGQYPTPIERLVDFSSGPSTLYVKKDDRVSDLYGGNKVRKLEYLLAAARSRGASRLLTLGAAGSHQIVAMALFGAQHGFEVDAVLVPQPASEHGKQNLRVALAHGLRAYPARAWASGPFVVARHWGRDARLIPLGGSNPIGSIGFVDAARELAAQVASGEMPEPDVIVVALGSGGTAAGLAVGLEQAQMRTRVVGVAVSHPSQALRVGVRVLARRTAALVGVDGGRAVRRIDVDAGFVGRGYGHATRAGQTAIGEAASAGITLDTTYTAKAFACALARVRAAKGETVLYWHTLSSAPMETLLEGAPELPPRLAKLFR